MNRSKCLRLAAMIVAGALTLPAFADPPGKNPGNTHPHEAVPPSKVVCTPKAGTESMQHEPKDHPMPETRGMKNMDPAMHMLDCVDPDAKVPSEKLHEHKKLGS
jgi:hypothetical protein